MPSLKMFKNWAARHWATRHWAAWHWAARHWAENFRDGAASGPSCHTPPCYLLRGTAALASFVSVAFDSRLLS
jgi:hypothetical protein